MKKVPFDVNYLSATRIFINQDLYCITALVLYSNCCGSK